jgi:hypothetical protein
MHKLDIAALLSTLVGVSSLAADAGFQSALAPLLGGYAHQVLAVLALLGLISAQVLRAIGSPSTTAVALPVVPLSPAPQENHTK